LFGGLVAALVQELTSDKEEIDKIGKTAYMSKKLLKMSSWALVVKLADRLHNVQDITTAKTPEWRKKYKNETLSVLDNIEKNRILSGTHKRIIASIRKKLNEVPD
jgi:(p)ppGpp synthase/HD superfamily hydrolase